MLCWFLGGTPSCIDCSSDGALHLFFCSPVGQLGYSFLIVTSLRGRVRHHTRLRLSISHADSCFSLWAFHTCIGPFLELLHYFVFACVGKCAQGSVLILLQVQHMRLELQRNLVGSQIFSLLRYISGKHQNMYDTIGCMANNLPSGLGKYSFSSEQDHITDLHSDRAVAYMQVRISDFFSICSLYLFMRFYLELNNRRYEGSFPIEVKIVFMQNTARSVWLLSSVAYT